MLYSPASQIAFAHYPKTAGHSLVAWFQETFADAVFVEPPEVYTISHLPVRESLERLGPTVEPVASRWQRWLPRRLRQTTGLRIIGVMREPFEMLVSLYEYWRDYEFPTPPAPALIRAAREQPFPVFLSLAVGAQLLPNYHDFFDIGGVAWPRTRLLDFGSLDSALTAVCHEFGLPTPRGPLQKHNTGPKPHRDLNAYREAAGPLTEAVQRYFEWYYTAGQGVLVRG